MSLRRGSLRHLVVDRDGVLNHENESGGWVTSPVDFRWLPGSLDALVRLAGAGVRVTVATNQSCIGRGVAEPAQVEAVHHRMVAEAEAAGGKIAEVFVCPHAPDDGCSCRKPRPGLIESALAASDVPMEETTLVGDAWRDLEAGRAAGLPVALVRTGKGRRFEQRAAEEGIAVFEDFLDAVEQLLEPHHP